MMQLVKQFLKVLSSMVYGLNRENGFLNLEGLNINFHKFQNVVTAVKFQSRNEGLVPPGMSEKFSACL